MKDPAFLFYTKDFQSGTMDMSCEEVGAYIRLLMHQHQHGSVPDDLERMMRITGIFSIDKFKMVWDVVKQKFNQNGNQMVNERLAKESADRATSKPKKIASATLAGLVSANKNLTDKQKYDIKKAFSINEFIEFEENEMKEKIREWFYKMVNQTVNNLANADANANASVNEDKGKGGTGEKPKTVKPNIDCEEVIKIFNAVCHKLPTVTKATDTRKIAIKGRVSEYGLSGVGDVYQKVAASRFLTGENNQGWKADFDWIMKPQNFIKILEGKYQNNEHGTSKSNEQLFADAMGSEVGRNFKFS